MSPQGTVGVRSALIVYSPSSQGKENLLRRPDEWGPLFFRALEEQKHNKLKRDLSLWEAGLPRLQAGKGKSPTSKDNSLKRARAALKAPEGGWQLGQGLAVAPDTGGKVRTTQGSQEELQTAG